MRRTDRLFDLIQILRDGRLHTAQDMARRLEVSTRTLWRDMATLIASGLPVEGERGVGYILREPITLPPLTLTPDEVDALHLGIHLVAQGADPSLGTAAESLRGKIAAVLPHSGRHQLEGDDALYVHPGAEALSAARHLPLLRRAIRTAEVVALRYPGPLEIERPVHPLVLEFWGKVWTLGAWCETRADFRTFRVDRMLGLRAAGRSFEPDAARGLAAYRARV
jgi:predicted DNA-binding transcriptional regulator YafY